MLLSKGVSLEDAMQLFLIFWNWCTKTKVGAFGYDFTFAEFWLWCILASIVIWFFKYLMD